MLQHFPAVAVRLPIMGPYRHAWIKSCRLHGDILDVMLAPRICDRVQWLCRDRQAISPIAKQYIQIVTMGFPDHASSNTGCHAKVIDLNSDAFATISF